MSDKEITELEDLIEESKRAIELMDVMEKLESNKDFKAIITEELLDKYARDTVYLLSNKDRQTEEAQKELIKELEMIGRFRQFCSDIYLKGRMAERTINESRLVIAELRSEGAY